MLNLNIIAEQLAIIGYFMLVAGIALELFFVKQDKRKQ
jgi:hypothetical protein